MTSLVQANVTIQGSITSLGTFGQTTFAPVDLGASALSLATGNLTSLITTTSSAPTGFAAAGEGALVFPGTANAYISFGTTGQPFSNTNIYAFGDFVVEAWVNPVSLAVANHILSMGDPMSGYYWYFSISPGSGTLGWYSYLNSVGSVILTNATLSTGTWYHLAVIHQNSTKRVQLYINGTPQTFGSTTNGFTSTGTVASYTTGVIPVTGQQLIIGQSQAAPMNAQVTNLRITTGPGAMYLYNNNAFTPSTSPLFPASNTAGGSLTTRLLVRVPLAPGKMVVPKLGGANCNTVLAFPPAPMTSYATNMTGQSYYGQGTYVASASSELNTTLIAWYAFDKNASGTAWGSTATYAITSPYGYSGTVTTVDVNGNSYAGEWLQIQKPSSVVPTSYIITAGANAASGQAPSKWWLLGSRDGVNWFLLDSRSGNTSWAATTPQTFTVSSSQSFTHFRIVVNQANGYVNSTAIIVFAEWTLNGSIESINVTADGRVGLGVVAPTRALEVAGDVVCGGTLSAGNPLMFRNALYNGDMRINQRGISTNWASPTAVGSGSPGIYATDRWNIYRGSYQTGAAAAQLSLTTTDQPYKDGLQYYLRVGRVTSDAGTNSIGAEYNMESRESYRFAGQPVTLSFYYRTGSGYSGSGLAAYITSGTGIDQNGRGGLTGSITVGNITFNASNAWQRAYVTGFVPTNATQVITGFGYTPSGTAGGFDYFDVTGVQLEKGSVATPYEIRPYGVELALCQRYLFQLSPQDTAPCYQRTSVFGLYTIRFPVTMRTGVNPTIFGGFNVSLGSTDTTQTSLTTPGGAYQPSATGSQYTFPSAQTIGLAGNITINASGYIRYDAEL